MNSCLYECDVMHHRLEPKVNQFRYRIFMFSLDLDEIDSLRIPFLSRNRWNLYEFRDRDHLTIEGLETKSVKENVIGYLALNGIQFPPGGRIRRGPPRSCTRHPSGGTSVQMRAESGLSDPQHRETPSDTPVGRESMKGGERQRSLGTGSGHGTGSCLGILARP